MGYRFGATVGQFCLLAGLRAQVSPGREGEFKEVSQERYVTFAYAPGLRPSGGDHADEL